MNREEYSTIKSSLYDIVKRHPRQYGVVNGTVVYDPGPNLPVTELMDRCPNCEVWGICDIRRRADEALTILNMLMRKSNAT